MLTLHSKLLHRFRMKMVTFILGDPTAALVPPNQCVLTEDWTSLPLESKTQVNHDTNIFTFTLPTQTSPLNLSTCACILASTTINDELVVRPYTPISTNAKLGSFDLMVKIYPDGELSQAMDALEIGETLDFKHISFNVKTQYPFEKKKIGMIVGGTGVTPMIQALHSILGTVTDTTEVNLLYGSQTQYDILAKEQIDEWAANSKGRLVVHHVLSDEPSDSDWTGKRGFVDENMIRETLPDAADLDSMIFVCGPPAMYESLCGPRTEEDVSGVLGEMGYNSDQIFKF